MSPDLGLCDKNGPCTVMRAALERGAITEQDGRLYRLYAGRVLFGADAPQRMLRDCPWCGGIVLRPMITTWPLKELTRGN